MHDEGIDLQVAPGTEVFSSEKSELILCQDEIRDGHATIVLYGLESKLTYCYGHLSAPSVKSFLEISQMDSLVINKAEQIGEVAPWPSRFSGGVHIPEDILRIYGRTFDHMEFCIRQHGR